MKKLLAGLALLMALAAILYAQEPARWERGVIIDRGNVHLATGDLRMGTGIALKYTVTTLTNAQVLALGATPITVIAAAGAGNFAEPLGGVLVFNRTASYAVPGQSNLRLNYVNSSGSVASNVIETASFLDASGDAIINFSNPADDTLITAAGELSNAAIVIRNVGPEFGLGDASNTLRVIVAYRVHSTGL